MRNVIVTGGSRGLGLATARTLAAAGYHVIAVARQPTAEITDAARAAADAGVGAIDLRCFDLLQIEALSGFVRSIRTEFGPIYGLVNNAGLGTSGVLGMMADAKIEKLIRLNTLSPIVLTKYVVRSMMNQREGRIISMSSIVASTGFNGLSVYGATKASLVGFTRSLARELGPLGITVNAVAPGFVDTEMTQELDETDRSRIVRRSALRRLAAAEDVARSVEFLLGDSARNITGTVLTVDAGATA